MTRKYECDACAFQIRSSNEDELIDIVREHANDMHGMNVSRAEVREGWEAVEGDADD